MIQAIITAIQQELVGALTMEQMKLLIKALYKHLPGLDAGENAEKPDEKQDMLPLFISAKRVEGCSEKSLLYYESTIRNMLDAIGKPECQITTEDLRGYLDNYQRRGTVSKVTLDNVRRILSSFSVQTGQVGASHSELAREWNCNRSTVTSFLKELESDGLVKVSTGNVSSVTDIKCLLGWQHGDKVTPNRLRLSEAKNLSSDNELVYQLII